MRRMLSALVLFVSIVVNTQSANAESIKAYPQAARGCIPRVSLEQAKKALERFNFKTNGATGEEIRALGTGLIWIEALNGGKPLSRAHANNRSAYTFRFRSGSGHSHQAAHEIVITRNGARNNGERVAQLVHELGHFLGNNGAYSEYIQATGGSMCRVTSYSLSRPNEQFAEVFATFVTFPEHLKKQDSNACRKAYAFFERKMFSNGILAQRCNSKSLRPGVDYLTNN